MNRTGTAAGRRLFLGVSSSANGVAWTHRLTEADERAALAMTQAGGIDERVARILAARGVRAEHAAVFLEPTIRRLLPDPATLTDMRGAAARLALAIRRRERIAVFGDYDVDGAASCALLARYLRAYGLGCEVYIPDRIFEGYGPNPDAMRELAGRASLVLCVDCGTNSAAAILAAREKGADVVVFDHHQPGGRLPAETLVVNPNRDDDSSGQGHLCAAGVVFLALVETARQLRASLPDSTPPDLLGLLDLVALATICDVVPLTGVNRAYVVRGLDVARRQTNPGIAALARLARVGEPLNAFHLGFLIGPRINAGGRIGDAALGSRLLASDDPGEVETIAARLDQLNRERQAMEQAMLAEAMAEAEAELAGPSGPAILVTGRDSWHAGVVGLIASRLKDRARRPVFAVAFNADGIGTGSGRSVPGLDLGRLVRAAVERGLLVKGGGHAMAAGITVERARLGELRAFLDEQAGAAAARLRDEDAFAVDGAVLAEGVTPEFLDALECAGPFGSGHATPTFALPRHRLLDVAPVGTGHLRAELQSPAGGRVRGIAFRAAATPLGDFLLAQRGNTVHLAGTLAGSTWQGTRRAEVRISDAALPG